MPFITVQKVCKQFGTTNVLSDVGFCANPGEILGLIGPNGAGKTTLLECIAGLLPADGGVVLRDGKALSPRERRFTVHYMPDGIVPYPEHRVEKVIAFFRSVFHRSTLGSNVEPQTLDLSPVKHLRVGELSKGWRRRFLLAIALSMPHPVVLIDEPFDGLDLRQAREVMHLIRNYAAGGRTLILSIHQLSEAERICDRLVLLNAGEVAAEGTLAELRSRAGLESGSLEDVFLALS